VAEVFHQTTTTTKKSEHKSESKRSLVKGLNLLGGDFHQKNGAHVAANAKSDVGPDAPQAARQLPPTT
jgi:hypothetical protein